MKITEHVLDNGLKLIFCNDNSKHCTIANLFVKFGGANKKIIINDEIKSIKNGMAHFMEHLLIEHSIYGNSLLEFNKKHTYSNGFTNDIKTEYYINSVNKFEEDLIKLLNIVNNSQFTKDDVEATRAAIIKEKMMSKDEDFRELYKAGYECLFNSFEYPNVLGEIEDIESISYEDIKMCYDTFYQPKNQILVISGKFNESKILKIIEETYKKINKPIIEYKLPEIKENNKVKEKEKTIKRNVYTDYVRINYKINIGHLNEFEQIKLGFYIEYFLSYLFDESSKLYNELVDKKVCIYSINYGFEKVDDFYIIKIGTYTNDHKTFIDSVKDTIGKKEINENNFNIRKKESIIELILREDSLFSMIKPFFDNILNYNYYELDKIEDIEKQNFDDYKKMINDIDFNNYCITKMIRKND
ncbi:MAG: insulinase family protein [Lactobacillales bacterium]|nr:insulinase family protein [Lactobacillales bacterium]